MESNIARLWDATTRNEYRRGHPGASDEDIDTLMAAEAKTGWPPNSVEDAREVIARADASEAASAPTVDPVALAAEVGKVVDEKLMAFKAGTALKPGTRFEVAERDENGRAKQFKVLED